MTLIDEAFDAVPERIYTHHDEHGETPHRSQPDAIRRDVISLDVHAGDRVLELGTGSGYSSAVLAQLCGPHGRVTSVDISAELVERATAIHHNQGIRNVDCRVADGLAGCPDAEPYQRIVGWCTFARLPKGWVDQLDDGGRIVACLPLTELPYITVIAAITVSDGIPRVQAMTSGGYVQSRPQPYDDVHMPYRWVDATLPHTEQCWISTSWRDHDDPAHTGARTALNLLITAGHSETYPEPMDWRPWNAFTGTLDDAGLSIANLPGRGHAIGHTTPTSAAMMLVDGTIVADTPGSPSLDVLHGWLTRWEEAGRPAAEDLTPVLLPSDSAECPGWDLRVTAGRPPVPAQHRRDRRAQRA